ncbi:Uncharacterised protein [Legionella feeleii]|uniref:Uncharacterized protein n=1 Tax=Legionella feeleii TaxID=453 RepID=A0A378IUC4_9GAMM|nr:Uncharacterised protein [Legionella feeleii]
MQTVSYTYMRKHLCEIMERIANGKRICFAHKGQEPFIIDRGSASVAWLLATRISIEFPIPHFSKLYPVNSLLQFFGKIDNFFYQSVFHGIKMNVIHPSTKI